MQFETEDAVDDIRCNMTDGSYVVIQAKRTCGNDKHLVATVDQWVRQLSSLGDGDRVAIVVRNPKGPIKHLKEALDNNRADFPRLPTQQMTQALDAISAQMPVSIGSGDKDKLLKRAYCIEARAEKEGDSQFDIAVALLDGVVVERGFGVVAVKILQRNFQEGAATGVGSTVKDWILWFQDGGLQPRSNANGSPGQQQAAEVAARSEFLNETKQLADKLQYSLLAEDLPVLEVPDLVRSFQASIIGKEKRPSENRLLISIARRWRRFFLVGLPGSGKSVAVRQIAAHWADQPGAPIPIVVSLKRVAENVSEPRDVTLDLLIDVATSGKSPEQKVPLKRAMLESIGNGSAAIIMDGLDECRSLAGVVSIGIQQIIGRLHDCNTVIVTGRESSLLAAQKLNLPTVRLTEPASLETTMARLLSAIADLRIPEDERDSWLTEKKRNLSASKTQHPDIWSVPLLATMLTLLSATTDGASLPANRAKILHSVVQTSIRKWELGRGIEPPGGWNENLNSAKLLDGFATIGHAVNQASSSSSADVDRALLSMLSKRWGSPRGEAEFVAPDIRWFWDQNVGVFVAIDSGRATSARSRQFIEIAEAVWASQQEKRDVISWLTEMVRDSGMQEAVVLAAGLSPEVAEALLDVFSYEEDTNSKLQIMSWLLLSQENEITLPVARLKILIEMMCDLYAALLAGEVSATQVADALSDGGKTGRFRHERFNRQLEFDGPGWMQIAHLARVPIPSELRHVRDARFAELRIDTYKRNVLGALTALTDAGTDRVPLTPAQVHAVRQLFQEELVHEGGGVAQVSRRSFRIVSSPVSLLSGHYAAGLLAVKYLDELGPSVYRHLSTLAERGPASKYFEIAQPLRLAGVEIEGPWTSSKAFKQLQEIFGDDDFWDGILEPISQVSNYGSHPVSPACTDRDWRMPDLVALLELIGIAEVGIQDYRLATDSDAEHLALWLGTFAKVCGIDVSACAQQASQVLDDEAELRLYTYDFLFTSLNHPDPEPLDASMYDIRTLVSIIGDARSDWMASTASILLSRLADARTLPHLEQLSRDLPPDRRRLATVTLIFSSPDPLQAAGQMYESEKPVIRCGVAMAVSMMDSNEPRLSGLRESLLSDEDATVRWYAVVENSAYTEVGASYWSCPECAGINDIASSDCRHCDTGSKSI
ncbi:NACHT domain-containing protein [Streptomyces sp. NPDC059467]|uniref:NACHT domain-containing protein n=1 Tax=Streptomyces sp. NPDC059467 TaxID=3346844 RepID=UPI0036AFBE09